MVSPKVESETVRVNGVLAQVIFSAPRLVVRVKLGDWPNTVEVPKRTAKAINLLIKLNLTFLKSNIIYYTTNLAI